MRRIRVNGRLARGVYAKDVILEIIRRLGVNGGVGYAYEYAGDTDRAHVDGRADDDLQHVDRGRGAGRLRQSRTRRRSTTCAAAGSRRKETPSSAAARGGAAWPRTPARRTTTRSRSMRRQIGPTVTWGINPGQSVYVDERCRPPTSVASRARIGREALDFMGFRRPGSR